jgi:zinc transport system substrate-binding protein
MAFEKKVIFEGFFYCLLQIIKVILKMSKNINRNYYYLRSVTMKKLHTLVFVLLTALLLVGCSDKENSAQQKNENAIDVYTTVYPLQYFAERIGGDYANVQSIYPPGANEHTFEPTQKDMIDLADADLFFYVGLGLEGFVEKSKSTLKNQNVKLVPTATNISEEDLHISTGHTHAEAIENVENGHDDHHDHEESHNEDEHDAHVWLSPVLSQQLATVIKDELISAMPEQQALFTANYDALIADLQELHTEFEEMAKATSQKTFFVSHAAFGYYAGHYNLNQVPVAGLNSQSEPSQKELTAIVDLANKENIQYIFFEQNINSKLAKIIQNEVGAKTLTLHNLSVLTEEDIKNNEDYFTLMRANMAALKKALQ